MKENEDYELVPLDDDDVWGVRFKTGSFVETVIKFGAIQANEEDEHISFSFDIVSSPDGDLTTENMDLQEHVGKLLSVVIEDAISAGDT